jgi:branched-subunit amino acid transport protein AzlD
MPGTGHALIIIAVVAVVTFATRALPFVFFGGKRPTPKFILYLGKALPSAVMAMLVVYCLKGVSLAAYPYGLPELIAIAVVVALQVWKRNSLISIFSGTAVYMLAVQVIFK